MTDHMQELTGQIGTCSKNPCHEQET